MRHAATTLLFILLWLEAFAQQPPERIFEKPRIDKNVELLSVVWRLAGADLYNQPNSIKQYVGRIEEHFGKYRKHKLIRFVRRKALSQGIVSDAVADIAVLLDSNLNLKTNVTRNSLDNRWDDVDKDKFVSLLKKFAADTGFNEFYENNSGFYAEASRRFMPIYEAVDLKWYADFFGQEPKEKLIIINALGNGGASYCGPVEYSDGRREAYAFLGAWNVDDQGMVVFPMEPYLSMIIHEFLHSFITPLTEEHMDEFETGGGKLYKKFEDVMSGQGYGEMSIMLNEALIRAAVIIYRKDHGAGRESLDRLMESEKKRGFVWIEELIAELEKYKSQRDNYPTLGDYMAVLGQAYEVWADSELQ